MSSFPLYSIPGLTDRPRRVRADEVDDSPEAIARRYGASSLSRVSPVVDVEPGSVFSRAAVQPAPNTISTSGRAAYEPNVQPAPRVAPPLEPGHAGFVDEALSPTARRPLSPGEDLTGFAYGSNRVSAHDPQMDLYKTLTPGPEQQELARVQAAGPKPSHGWGRVGRVLLNLGLGNPVGAAVEGIAPGYAAKRRFESYDLPRAQHNAQVEEGMASQRLGDISRVAADTGVLPSGQPTEIARHRMAAEDETKSRNRMMDENRDLDRRQRLDIAKQAETAKRRRDLVAIEKAGMGNEATRRELAAVSGLPGELAAPFIRGDIEVQTDDNGNFIGISKKALQEGKPAVTNTGVGSIAGRKQAGVERAQAYREWLSKQKLSREDQRIAIYRDIASKKGAESPEAQAFAELHQAGKIDDKGMADNPKYQAELGKALDAARAFAVPGESEDDVLKRAKNRLAAKGIAEKIPYTELDDFKGLKGVKKVAGNKSASTPKPVPRASVEAYAKKRGISYEEAERQAKAEGYQVSN